MSITASGLASARFCPKRLGLLRAGLTGLGGAFIRAAKRTRGDFDLKRTALPKLKPPVGVGEEASAGAGAGAGEMGGAIHAMLRDFTRTASGVRPLVIVGKVGALFDNKQLAGVSSVPAVDEYEEESMASREAAVGDFGK
jgi:hypothetical protein